MTRARMMVLFVLLTGILGAGLARAEGGGDGPERHHPPHHGAHLLRAVESLDLTADQQAAIDAIKAEVRDEREARRAEFQAGRPERQDALQGLLTEASLDRDAAHAALDEAAALRQERAHAELDSMLDVLEILTPEQRTALAAQLEARRQEHAEQGEGGERRRHR